MTDSKHGRPVEKHITTVDTVDLDAMSLITSMAYGERHVSKMLNLATAGLGHPGFYTGFIPEPNGGLEIKVAKDRDARFNVAIVEVGDIPIRVFQQHDIVVTLRPNKKNVVVLEAFYQDRVETAQVTAKSDILPARLRVLLPEEVNSDHLIICDVDLTTGAEVIEQWMIDTRRRRATGLDVYFHVHSDNPHPQYNPRQKANIIEADTDELSTTNINLIVGDYSKKLRPYEDGTIIELEIISSLDLDEVDVVLTPPDGEELMFKKASGTSYVLKKYHTRLYRYNGRWHI